MVVEHLAVNCGWVPTRHMRYSSRLDAVRRRRLEGGSTGSRCYCNLVLLLLF